MVSSNYMKGSSANAVSKGLNFQAARSKGLPLLAH